METYEVGKIVKCNEVPNWARRERKWGQLLGAISELAPGYSLTVTFPTLSAANRARNTVRDTINLRIGRAVIRTRLTSKEDGQSTVYFTRLHDHEVVEEARIME